MDILDLRPWQERAMTRLQDPRSWGARTLAPLSLLYRAGAQLHRIARPRRPLPEEPVSIAIGNLRVGGSGKTPVTAEVVRLLQMQGVKCAVLSRGFRAEGGGDEPTWLKRETGGPVIMNRDRRLGFEEASKQGVDAVVLDDAFQSRGQAKWRLCVVLAKDLANPPRVLPAGPYREPPSALDRAHAILIRREPGDEVLEAPKLEADQRPVFAFRMVPTEVRDSGENPASLEEMKSWGTGLLVSGLARPESLEADAELAGASLALSLRFSDHAGFGPREKESIEAALRRCDAGWILTSEKNLQRLLSLDLAAPVWALRSELQWDGDGPAEWLRERV